MILSMSSFTILEEMTIYFREILVIHSLPFTSTYYQFQNWPYDDFYQAINESEKPFLRNSEEVEIFNNNTVNMIIYGVPVPFNSKHPYGTLLFFIDERMIQNMLKNIVNTPGGNAFILDNQHQVVASLYNRDNDFQEIYKHMNVSGPEGLQNITINNQTYYVSHVKSEFLDWSFFTLTPESELMKDVNSVRNKVLVSYAIILLIGGGLIYIGMQINYKPLGRLIRRAEEKWSRVLNQHHGVEKIWEAINYSETRNQLLSKSVEKSRPLMQQHLFTRLLRGEISDYQAFNKLGKEIDLHLEAMSYYVMLMEFKQEDETVNPLALKRIKEWIACLPSTEKYQIDLFGASAFILILSGEPDQSMLIDWYKKLNQDREISVTIGVGNSYDEAIQIGKSHLEAATALQYKLIKGMNQIIFFSETSAENLKMKWYDKQIVEQLDLFIRQRDMKQIEKVLEQITNIIRSPDSNLFLAKCLMFDVSGVIMRIVQDMQPIQSKLEGMMPDVLKINDFHSLEEMEKTVNKIIQEVLEVYEQSGRDHILLDDLLQYLQDHYHEYQFSIQALAEHYSLSEAYIMRYFKKHTGETILQHLNRLRMEQTKYLLKTSDLQIKEIAIRVGYSDVSSFIRKFKQQEKMTPGEFRKKYTNKNVI